jgi:hypothetical protein
MGKVRLKLKKENAQAAAKMQRLLKVQLQAIPAGNIGE